MKYIFTITAFLMTFALIAQPTINQTTTHELEVTTTPFQDEAEEVAVNKKEESVSNVVALRVVKAEEEELFIPTNFNPNNPLQKVFTVEGGNVQIMEMCIFNQWGELVYFSKLKGNWDGTNLEGKKAEAGIYVYTIKARVSPYKTTKLSGCVTLEE